MTCFYKILFQLKKYIYNSDRCILCGPGCVLWVRVLLSSRWWSAGPWFCLDPDAADFFCVAPKDTTWCQISAAQSILLFKADLRPSATWLKPYNRGRSFLSCGIQGFTGSSHWGYMAQSKNASKLGVFTGNIFHNTGVQLSVNALHNQYLIYNLNSRIKPIAHMIFSTAL